MKGKCNKFKLQKSIKKLSLQWKIYNAAGLNGSN